MVGAQWARGREQSAPSHDPGGVYPEVEPGEALVRQLLYLGQHDLRDGLLPCGRGVERRRT